MTAQFRLLGGVEVELDGGPLPIGHDRQRCVLGALLVDANRPVMLEELIERVWADREPRHVRGVLYNYLSRLRHLLAAAHVPIQRRGGGYVIVVDPMDVDLHRFRALVAASRVAATDEEAADLAVEALGLWRGPAFGSLDTVWINQVRTGLSAERASAELDLGDLALRLGRHADLVLDLARREAADGLDERLTGQLMTALYRCGRQADALTKYQQLRVRLAEDLGVDPTPTLSALYRQILSNDPVLEVPRSDTAGSSRARSGAARPAVTWPAVVGEPPMVVTAFQHRPDVENRLEAAMAHAGSTTVLTQVLSGDGGIGKTQLAAAVFERARLQRTYDLLVWLSADSGDAVITGFADAMIRINPDAAHPDLPAAATAFSAWLRQTDRTWLIILDDVADPRYLTRWWPAGPGGRTLVTTRRRDAILSEQGRRVVDMGAYKPPESEQYLKERLSLPGTRSDILEGAVLLAEDMGHLPLALAQAAAVILDYGLTCSQYRARVVERSATLTTLFPAPFSSPTDQRQQTVAGTWALAALAANDLDPAGVARPVMELIAVLDPNGVPRTVMAASSVARYVMARTDTRRARAADDLVGAALRNLHRLSLVTHRPDDPARSVRMHAIAQRAAREALDADVLRSAYVAAADALIETWPDIESDRRSSAAFRSSASILIDQSGDTLWAGAAHPVLLRLGRSLGDIGLVGESLSFWQRIQEISRRLLGPHHPDTLSIRSHLANGRGKSGDRRGAVSAFDELVPDLMQVLGRDDPRTLTARGDRARWAARAGDPAGAMSALSLLLGDRIRIQGSDHRDTLKTRSDLAYARGQAGHPIAAVESFEALAPEAARILGADHPDTLTIRDHLARWRALTGNPAKAAADAQQLLLDRLRVLGPDHLDTLAARGHLAFWTGMAGRPADAVTAIEVLLRDALRLVGPDHPGVLAIRGNLAYWQGLAGDPAAAAGAMSAVLTDRIRILGPNHPDTLSSRAQLAHWTGVSGDPGSAVAILAELLIDRLRVLGAQHPDTQDTQHAISRWRRATNVPE